MSAIRHAPLSELGHGFIPSEFIPAGKDEYYLRFNQQFYSRDYRPLEPAEVDILVGNANTCDDWRQVFVTDTFNPDLVENNHFHGLIRIGALERNYLEHHDLRIPEGIYNSTIVSCDIGSHVAIDHARYLAHYILADRVMLLNVDEMHVTDHAKFGNGILKQGEPESDRIWIELWNEAGGRRVLPFDGMLAADAYLWARYRAHLTLQERFRQYTDDLFDDKRGHYGTVGEETVIKHCRIIKDVRIGSHAYLKGANKLKNLTINSNSKETTQIGEGVELVNGIIGYGCRIFYGVKAVRFILADHSNLKYGARLLNSFLGENSTISCCEVLNSLIFPSHEQHHNNSFLIASLIQGQSNMAANATVGSNHNSRANDGELIAHRGFWPGLCTSFKHSSRFKAFSLVVKGHYPAELDIQLPFSLVANNESTHSLDVIPAFWFLYNMYALVRNSWKFQARDKRTDKKQNIEFDYLAPDTVQEMLEALPLLEIQTAKAWHLDQKDTVNHISRNHLRVKGHELLIETHETVAQLEILAEGFERSNRKTRLLKADRAYQAYREMVHYYAVTTICRFLDRNRDLDFVSLPQALPNRPETLWHNIGGQIMADGDLTSLLVRIESGELDSWKTIHQAYDAIWKRYPAQKTRHAMHALERIHETTYQDMLLSKRWITYLDHAQRIQEKIAQAVLDSREKDYRNPYRRMVYTDDAERDTVMGKLQENAFIQHIQGETEAYRELIARCRKIYDRRQ